MINTLDKKGILCAFERTHLYKFYQYSNNNQVSITKHKKKTKSLDLVHEEGQDDRAKVAQFIYHIYFRRWSKKARW